ncbi:GIY-YIG nuclease family protein [Candidatus Omnitrophota bacterium]
MYYIYALLSKNKDRIYVGLTKNLDSRLKEHKRGKTKSTKYYRPWTLLYHEQRESRLSARKREKELKSSFGKRFLRKLANRSP